MTPQLSKTLAQATTNKTCPETGVVIDMQTGAEITTAEHHPNVIAKPPLQAVDFLAHTKSWPVLQTQPIKLSDCFQPMQQQQGSGGLLNLSDSEIKASRARQNAYIATLK